MSQRTIAESVSCSGVGLHGGAPVRLALRPARADSGIVFARVDRSPPVEIRLEPAAVRATRFATTLARGGASVGTVEHLLAALYGLGVDNVRVEVEGPELPAMDGSAAPFAQLVRSAGISTQPAAPRSVGLRRAVEVRDGGRWIRAEPAPALRISYAIEFDHPAIARQELCLDSLDPERFERELAGARTFGFLEEVQGLRRKGYARGGSLASALVLDARGVMNPEGLRWPDEFVRHKVLDLLGDLALLGARLEAHVRAERGGHALHRALVTAILEQNGPGERRQSSTASSSQARREAATRSVNSTPKPG